MSPNMLTLTNILLILAGCHFALGKDLEDDSIRFPSDTEISFRRYSPDYHSHHENFNPELRNPSTKSPIEPSYQIDSKDDDDEENEIPTEIWREIALIQDPNELKQYFERLTNQTMDFPDRFGEEKKPTTSKNYVCKNSCTPEYKRITLKDEIESYTENHLNDKLIWFYPKCIQIEQCGGCCNGNRMECEPKGPTETVDVEVYLRTKKNLSMQTTFIKFERHLKCGCQCSVKEDVMNCNPLQIFDAKRCSCLCNNVDELDKCKANGHIKEWDVKTCQCKCRNEPDCSTGERENYQTCGCEKIKRRSASFINENFQLSNNNRERNLF